MSVNEHEAFALLREANPIRAADLPHPDDGPGPQQLLLAILRPSRMRIHARSIASRRIAVVVVGLAALATGVLAFALFPGESHTADGLSSVSTRGTASAFAKPSGNLGTPYILREVDGRVFFRAALTPAGIQAMQKLGFHTQGLEGGNCYGVGKLVDSQINPGLTDCTRFPSEERPVLLDQVGLDVSVGSGGGTLLFAEGFAADGVARIQLVNSAGDVVSDARVEQNVFVIPHVEGMPIAGLHLVALDGEGNEVWRSSL